LSRDFNLSFYILFDISLCGPRVHIAAAMSRQEEDVKDEKIDFKDEKLEMKAEELWW
jgi:hypothetical protein